MALAAGASCGSQPAPPPGAPDGDLDCPPEMGDERAVAVAEREPGAVGARTPFDAMVEEADILAPRYGADDYGIHVIDARTGTVVAEGREVALLKVEELPTETFMVEKVERCPDFQVRREAAGGG